MPSTPTVKLPNADSDEVSCDKILGYLLCLDHPDGNSKARFFMRFGFSREEWPVFAQALKVHAGKHAAISVVESDYGRRYAIQGDIESPDGRNPNIRTVWMIEYGNNVPRLITAHPV